MELWILGCGSWESVTNAAGLCPPPLSYSSTFTEICAVHNPLSASWYLWTGLWCYCSQPAWPVSAELGLVQKGKGLCLITFKCSYERGLLGSFCVYSVSYRIAKQTYCSGAMWVTVRRQLSSEKECSWNSTHSGRPSLVLSAWIWATCLWVRMK